MAEQAETPDKKEAAIYENFDAFLRAAIYEFYRTGGKNNKGAFVALLIASGEVAALALDVAKDKDNLKRLAIGAVSVVALRLGLKYALSGPLGILLAAGTAASLLAYLVRNRKEVSSKVGGYRALVAQTRNDFEKLQSDHRDGRLTVEQRNLMVDGMMKRLLTELDR